MPRLPRLPLGTLRFFGRIDRFTCECPQCGQLIVAQFTRIGEVRRELVAGRRQFGKNRKGSKGYNPVTQRLICPMCSRVWGVGLLLYPVGARTMSYQPYDTRPSYPQLLAIRQLSGGYNLPSTHAIKGSDSVNIAVSGVCTCTLADGDEPYVIYDPTCPVHGWEEQLGPKTPEEQAKMAQAYEAAVALEALEALEPEEPEE